MHSALGSQMMLRGYDERDDQTDKPLLLECELHAGERSRSVRRRWESDDDPYEAGEVPRVVDQRGEVLAAPARQLGSKVI